MVLYGGLGFRKKPINLSPQPKPKSSNLALEGWRVWVSAEKFQKPVDTRNASPRRGRPGTFPVDDDTLHLLFREVQLAVCHQRVQLWNPRFQVDVGLGDEGVPVLCIAVWFVTTRIPVLGQWVHFSIGKFHVTGTVRLEKLLPELNGLVAPFQNTHVTFWFEP